MTRDEMLQSIINLIEILSFDTGQRQTLDGAARLIGSAARDIFSADAYAFLTINPVTGELIKELTVVTLDQNNEPVSTAQEIDTDVLDALHSETIQFITNLPEQKERARFFQSVPGINQMVGIALGAKGTQKPIAMIFLGFKEDQDFCENAQGILSVFQHHASPVLRNLWLLHRYQEVQRIGQEINQELETAEKLFDTLKKDISGLLDTSYFFTVTAYQPSSDTVDFHMSECGKTKHLLGRPLGGGTAWVIKNKKSLLIHNFTKEMLTLPVELGDIEGTTETADPQSLIYVPLIFRDSALGVLSIQHSKPNAFDEDDVQILKLLANHIAMALNNMRLYRNLRSLNETGELLTQQLDSTQVLQNIVDQIRDRTKTDIAILFPYIEAQQTFELPPTMSGDLRYPNFPRQDKARPDDIATLALQYGKPEFEDSSKLFEKLGGKPANRLGNFEQREQLSSTAMVPLRVGEEGEIVGVLFVNYRQKQRFDAPQRHLILGLSNYAAIAIENSRKFGAMIRNRTEELNILGKIAREISKTLDLNKILSTILDAVTTYLQPRFGVDSLDAAVLLYNAANHCLEVRAARGRSAATREGRSISLATDLGITRWVFENKQPARVVDVRNDLMWRDIYYLVDQETQSELDVPLIVDDKVEGILNFESRERNKFSQADQDFISNVAEQAVLAIRNAKAYAEQMRVVERLSAFGVVAKQLREAEGYEDVWNSILDRTLNNVDAAAGQILMGDLQRGELYDLAQKGSSTGKENFRQLMSEGVVGYAIRHQKTVMCKVDEPPWAAMYLRIIPDVYWELVTPIIINDQAVGAINIERQVDRSFSEQDVQFVESMADVASIAWRNAFNVQRAAAGKSRLSVLRNIDQQIISQLDNADSVMQIILEDAINQTGADTGKLYLFKDAVLECAYVAETQPHGQRKIVRNVSTETAPLGLDEISALVARSRTPMSTPAHEDTSGHLQSVIAAPLLSGEELVGVITIQSVTRHAFDEEDLEMLVLLAGQAVIAIQHAQAYAQTKAAEKLFERLYHSGRTLAKFTDMSQINEVYQAIISAAEELSPMNCKVLIWRYEEGYGNGKPLRLVAQGEKPTLPPPDRMATSEGVNGLVSQVRKTVVVPDAANPPHGVTPALYDPNIQSIVVTPILFNNNYYGNVALSHDEVFHFRNTEDPEVMLIRGLTRQLAITINRLETVQAQREAEARSREAEIMSVFGEGALEMSHRIIRDLGLVKSYVNIINGKLNSERSSDVAIAKELRQLIDKLNHNIQPSEGEQYLPAIEDRLKTMLETLESQGPVERDIAQELHKIVEAVSRTLDFGRRLKNDIAQFNREGLFMLPREIVPANELLSEIMQDFPPLPSDPLITLREIGLTDDLGKIHVVPRHIVSILNTLVSNAIDAMPDGGTITVTGRSLYGQVAIEVSDTGMGISEDIQPKIFNFMFSTKGSSGFGLWSAYRYARLNSGVLTVTSEERQGTTFTLTLPRAEEVVRGI